MQAPTILGFYILGFLGCLVFHLFFRARVNNRVSAANIWAQLRQPGLALAVLFCLVMGFFLLVSIIRTSETQDFYTEFWLSFFGNSPNSHEIRIWLISWFLTSSLAFAFTSTNTDSVQIDNAAQKLAYSAAMSLSNGTGREFVILQLAERASHLQQRSGYILIGIIFMLICAAIFIVFAGQITTLDVSGVKLVSLAQSDVRTAEDELERIISEMTRKQEIRQRAKEQGAKGEQRGDTPTSEAASMEDMSIKLKLEAKKEALIKANEVLLRVKDKQYEDYRPKDQISSQLLLIQTSITRFGVVLILIFLVQILVNLYRYNMRLSAFYFGRADSLVLLSKLPNDLRVLVEVISPDKLDFGKLPRTPAQEVGGVLESWTGRVPGRRSSRGQDDSNVQKKKKGSDDD